MAVRFMTNEEVVDLIQSHIDEKENLALLYKQNKGFIYKLALPYSKKIEIEYLMQEAYFGLSNAAYSFNKEKDCCFTTWAAYKIQAVMQRYCFNNALTKRIPIHTLETIHKYHSFRQKYFEEHFEYPTDEEIQKNLKIGKSKLNDIKQIICAEECKSLNAVISNTEDFTLEDTIADEKNIENDITDKLTAEQLNNEIWEAVNELDKCSSEIITGIYKNGKTQEYYSALFNLSNARIGEMKKKALKTLQKSEKIKEAAAFYGYDSFLSYHWGISKFKNTFTSGTEMIALKHLELEQLKQQNKSEIQAYMKVW